MRVPAENDNICRGAYGDEYECLRDFEPYRVRLDDGSDAATWRDTVDRMKDKLVSGVVVLAAADPAGGKVSAAVGVTKDLTGRLKAGELVNAVAAQVGGKGGGRPDFAQAGGTDVAALDGALAVVPAWVTGKLA